MSILLKIDHSGWDDEDLQTITSELRQVIEDETDIDAQFVTTEAKAGTKAADYITIGGLILSGIGSASGFEQILNIFFDRNPTLKLHLKNNKGEEIKITAKNLKAKKIQEILLNLPLDDD